MKGKNLWFKSKDSRLIVRAVPLVSYITGIKSLNFFDLQFSPTCMEIIPNFNGLLEVKKAKEMCIQKICLLALPVRSLSSQVSVLVWWKEFRFALTPLE